MGAVSFQDLEGSHHLSEVEWIKRYFQRKWTKRRPKFFESFSTRW